MDNESGWYQRLKGRIELDRSGNSLGYVRYLDDFPAFAA